MKKFLEAGQIVGTHGIKGELRVLPWCDSPEFLSQFDRLYFIEDGKAEEEISVETRPHKNVALMKMERVTTIQEADALRNKVLYINREDVSLEEGQFFVQDLIGMKVVDADTDEKYGELVDISPTGANDIYHVKTEKGEVLIPAIEDVIVEKDIENGLMKIRPLEGLFDDEE